MFGGFPGMGGFPGGGFGGHPGQAAEESDDGESTNTDAYYQIMGLEKSASDAEIKKAYRKKARELHPDRHPGPDKEEFEKKFKDLQNAYEILKDPQKRQLYDKYGEAGLKSGGGSSGGMGDIFDMFFRGGHGHGGHAQQRQKKAPAIKVFLDITLEDCYVGSTKEMAYQRYTLCADCDGKGGKKVIECDQCDGTGRQTIHQRMGYITMQTQRECPKCDAQGTIIPPKFKCKTCEGKGMKKQTRKIDLPIPMGSKNADKVVLRGQGHEIPDAANGDVLVILRVAKHDVFERVGADLAMSYEISLKEALCGYDVKIKHFGKKVLHLKSRKGEIVQPGQLKRVLSQGMPQKGAAHTVCGHLYVKFEVKFPESGDLTVGEVEKIKVILPEEKGEELNDVDMKSNDKANDKSNVNSNNNNGNNGNKNKNKGKNKGKKNKGKKNKGKNKNKNRKNSNNNNSNKQNGSRSNSSNASQSQTPDVDEDEEEDMIDEVTADDVAGEPKTTPASARSAYDEDEEGEGVQCQQM